MAQKLLLADDSVTIQRVIELTFADENIDVIAVSDGDQAIARLESDPPDIVLADIGMPGKDGYEVASFVKHSPRLAHIPVVLLTGAFEPIDQARAAHAGSDGVLAKPFEPQLVIARVKELLSQPARAPMPEASLAPAAAPTTATWPPRTPTATTQARDESGALGDYFDRLDAAFADRAAQPSGTTADRVQGAPDMKWFKKDAPRVAEPAPEPQVSASEPSSLGSSSLGSSSSLLEPPSVAESASVASSSAPASQAPVSSAAALPSIGDAFAALLAAEAGSNEPAVTWPGVTPSTTVAPAIGDEVIEQVVRRVLERLTDRVVRETVAEIVSASADRLVREEIDRIKATIK